jgi:hypothetical protein
MLVRGPSPPELPLLDKVSVAFTSCLTLVAVLPRRKKTQRRVKGMAEGCRAWIVAVRAAARMPGMVRERRVYERRIRRRVIGTAIMGRIM